MIGLVTGWFEITQYSNKTEMKIVNLVETKWLVRYPWPVDITYDQGREFLGHEFKNNFIERWYEIKTYPYSFVNPQANTAIEIINKSSGNLLWTYNLHKTYADDDDPWMEILAEAAFEVWYTYHRTRFKSTGKLFFGRYMILPINQIADWRYMCQRKQAQILKTWSTKTLIELTIIIEL